MILSAQAKLIGGSWFLQRGVSSVANDAVRGTMASSKNQNENETDLKNKNKKTENSAKNRV
jgi:hypothetical protein